MDDLLVGAVAGHLLQRVSAVGNKGNVIGRLAERDLSLQDLIRLGLASGSGWRSSQPLTSDA